MSEESQNDDLPELEADAAESQLPLAGPGHPQGIPPPHGQLLAGEGEGPCPDQVDQGHSAEQHVPKYLSGADTHVQDGEADQHLNPILFVDVLLLEPWPGLLLGAPLGL